MRKSKSYYNTEENEKIQIGVKNGCLTIIDDISAYQKEVAQKEIRKLENEKQAFIKGIKVETNNFESVESFDYWIKEYKNREYYKCQCKCGLILYCNKSFFFRKRHRYCSNECGIKKKHHQDILNSYERVKDESYEKKLLNTSFESLEIVACIDDNYERLYSYRDKRKKGGGTYRIYKVYKCRCYLCGKEYEFLSSQFTIKNDEYGHNATKGYYCNACCDCHKISSFQWRTIDLFHKYNLNYKVEVSFPDLYGTKNKNQLRYDFAIYDEGGKILLLIECQGEQHYKPVKEFGGDYQYNAQIENDDLKRKYANEHGIRLIEIPYTCNTYEKEKMFLINEGVLLIQ